MTVGLGNILYRLFFIVAVFLLALGLLGFLSGNGQLIIGAAFFGVLTWLCGLACRYVLAGY